MVLPASIAPAGGMVAWLLVRRLLTMLAPAWRLPAVLVLLVPTALAIDRFWRWVAAADRIG